jgi:ATP-binding cassette subfamily F protein 3
VIELTADRFWLVANGRVSGYDGDMDTYRQLLLAGAKKASKKKESVADTAPDAAPEALQEVLPDVPAVDRREQRKQAAEKRQTLAPLRKQIQRIEKNVAKFQAEKAEIQRKMADPTLYDGDSSKLVDLQRDLGWISRQLDEAEANWLGLQEELEGASAVAD